MNNAGACRREQDSFSIQADACAAPVVWNMSMSLPHSSYGMLNIKFKSQISQVINMCPPLHFLGVNIETKV